MTLAEITTQDWQLAIADPSGVVTDMADIAQCIYVALFTAKGSDPLRPNFGCDMMLYIDQPENVAIPKMKKAIVETLTTWEPRITITKIDL